MSSASDGLFAAPAPAAPLAERLRPKTIDEVLGPFMTEGDIIGHEPMGVVEEVGPQAGDLRVGDRVVIPFNISCGHCYMCDQGLMTQCETTQVTEHGMGARLFGYTKLYGAVPGGQAEYLRVPHADFGPVKVPEGPGDDRFLFLSDVLPTAWQAVEYAGVSAGQTLLVLGAGPIGDMATRIALHRGVRVITRSTRRVRKSACFSAMRERSPAVSTPSSRPSCPTIASPRSCASVTTASRIVAEGASGAVAGSMTSATRSSLRPSRPPGCSRARRSSAQACPSRFNWDRVCCKASTMVCSAHSR